MIEGSKVLDEGAIEMMMLTRMTLMMAMTIMSWRKSERMIALMTSKRILMKTKRKVNRSRRKLIFGIFYRPHAIWPNLQDLEG